MQPSYTKPASTKPSYTKPVSTKPSYTKPAPAPPTYVQPAPVEPDDEHNVDEYGTEENIYANDDITGDYASEAQTIETQEVEGDDVDEGLYANIDTIMSSSEGITVTLQVGGRSQGFGRGGGSVTWKIIKLIKHK